MAHTSNDAPTNGAKSIAQDLFEDMGRQVNNLANSGDGSDGLTQDAKVVEEIESLCMNCHETGTTRLLLTRIPFFRELVIMSFACPHCHFHNNEIQSAGQIQAQGTKIALRIDSDADLQRQLVKSDVCVARVDTLDLEIPAGKGQYTNIEGVLSSVKADLEAHQAERLAQMPDIGAKVAGVIAALADMLAGRRFPFMVSVDDPSGNSSIEPRPGDAAGKWAKSEYRRTAAQNAALGLGGDDEHTDTDAPAPELRPEYRATGLVGGGGEDGDNSSSSRPLNGNAAGNNVDATPVNGAGDGDGDDIVENQVYSFPASCPGCTRPCATNMKMVNIPFFKQVVLMSTVCDACGYRSNEVKTGGEVPARGRRLTLRVRAPADLGRDLLKSESAALACPELQLRVEPGTMGGRFTTVEGILTQIRRDLRAQAFGLADGDADADAGGGGGDAMPADSRARWDAFFATLSDAIAGRAPFTLVLEDPLAASYVQSFTAPDPDPQIDVEDYERTDEEEEDLGLKDIKTEGYEANGEA